MSQQVDAATRDLQGSRCADPAARARGEAMLERGAALLVEMGDGPGSAELAASLRRLETSLARMTPDEAARTLPARPSSRTARLTQTAQRGVNLGAMAMTRTGDPESFANAVVGDMSDRHLRALGRLSEDDLRSTLADHGITGNRADRAIERVKSKIADRFQSVTRERGQRSLEDASGRLRRASRRGSPECQRAVGELMSGQGDALLRNLDTLGVNTSAICHALANADQGDARATMASLQTHVAAAMGEAADHVAEQAAEMAEWGSDELFDEARPSRSFPGVAQQVKGRWAMGGIVGEAVNEHVSQAREEQAFEEAVAKTAILAVGAVLGVVSGGVATGMAIAAASATTREGIGVLQAWDASDRTTARSLAGMATAEDAERARANAETKTAVAAGAVVVDTALAGASAAVHHGVLHRVTGAGARRAVDTAAALGEMVVGAAVEQGAHAVDHALQSEHH